MQNFKRTTTEEFVSLWQQSPSLAEMAKKTGWGNRSLTSYASLLRRKGVPLKRFHRCQGDSLNYAELAKLAKRLAPKA